MAIFIGLFVFLIGCCYTKCNKLAKCCACFNTAIISPVFAIIFIIFGAIFIGISSYGVKYVKDYCDGTSDILSAAQWASVTAKIDELQQSIAETPSAWMCTSACPCPPLSVNGDNGRSWFLQFNSTQSRTYQLTNYSLEAYANKLFTRTLSAKAGFTGFTFALNASNTSSYYTNFWDCYSY